MNLVEVFVIRAIFNLRIHSSLGTIYLLYSVLMWQKCVVSFSFLCKGSILELLVSCIFIFSFLDLILRACVSFEIIGVVKINKL